MATDMALGETLLARLAALFEQDPLIDEVGLLFGVEQQDLTPETAFILEEHKLGVAFSAGVPLFQAARTQFHPLNALLREEDSKMTLPIDSAAQSRLLHCTRALLLISADFYTAWNTRKTFVTRGWLDAQQELQFTNLVFSLHPKSIDTWAYRRWLAVGLCESLADDDRRRFFEQQVVVCSRLAEQKPRNYHAWSFRHWIVSRFQQLDLLQKELEAMERWCRSHVSDNSGWNHRQHTLNEVMNWYEDRGEAAAIKAVVWAEYQFLSELMAPYLAYEALWCHRRYVVQQLLHKGSQLKVQGDDVSSLQVSELVHELIARVQRTSLDTTAASVPLETEALAASWSVIHTILNREDADWVSTICALLQEIETAWRCGSRFPRRYAVWCLARLRASLDRMAAVETSTQDKTLTSDLGCLASSLKKLLAKEDEVLEDLWRRA